MLKKNYKIGISEKILHDLAKLLDNTRSIYHDKYVKYKTKYVNEKKLLNNK